MDQIEKQKKKKPTPKVYTGTGSCLEKKTNSYFIPEGYIYFSKYRKVINKRSAIVVC